MRSFHSLASIVPCIILSAVLVSTGKGAAPGSASADHKPNVIPWLEVNAPQTALKRWYPEPARTRPSMTVIDYCIQGLEHWAKVTDTAVVSTKPGKVTALYPQLMRRKPAGISIVGGLKTYILEGTAPGDKRPYDFADPNGWRLIAEGAKKIVEITGNNVVVLENETSLGAYHNGRAAIDCDKLAKSLKVLRETGIEFWWNLPRILEDTQQFPNRKDDTSRLVRTIAEALPNCVFLTGFTAWHGWERNRNGEVDRRKMMIELVGLDRMQERLLVTHDGYWHKPEGTKTRRCFTPQEADRQMKELPGTVFNIYPGGASWEPTSKAYLEMVDRDPH